MTYNYNLIKKPYKYYMYTTCMKFSVFVLCNEYGRDVDLVLWSFLKLILVALMDHIILSGVPFILYKKYSIKSKLDF